MRSEDRPQPKPEFSLDVKTHFVEGNPAVMEAFSDFSNSLDGAKQISMRGERDLSACTSAVVVEQNGKQLALLAGHTNPEVPQNYYIDEIVTKMDVLTSLFSAIDRLKPAYHSLFVYCPNGSPIQDALVATGFRTQGDDTILMAWYAQ